MSMREELVGELSTVLYCLERSRIQAGVRDQTVVEGFLRVVRMQLNEQDPAGGDWYIRLPEIEAYLARWESNHRDVEQK